MAKPQPVTEQEISLRKRARRRLVGAIALVLVVAVVLPWVVDDDPPPRLKNVDIAIPAVDSVDRKFPPAAPVAEPIPGPASTVSQEPVDVPVSESTSNPADAAPTASPQTVPAPAADARPAVQPAERPAPDPEASSAKAVVKPEPKAAVKPDPKPEAKAESKPAAQGAAPNVPGGRGFVMQVGAFSSSEKAKQLQQQLRAAGFPAYLEPVKTTSGERTRVRAGPFATVEAAQKARVRLLGLKVAQGDLKVVPREN